MSAERPGDFGAKLREARERKGVSLRQIAGKTKIAVAALEALERNDISRLPGGIFSRAFVRSYAAEVGLDPEKTIQEFITQFPGDSVTAGHPTSDRVEEYEDFESDRRMASTVLGIIVISLPLAGAVVYFSMTNRRANVVETPVPATSSAQAGAETAAVAPPSTAPAMQQPPPVNAPPATPPASSSTGPTTQPSASAPSAAAPSAAVQPAAAVGDVPADHLTIGLSARRAVFVSATVDGQRTISRLLQAGEKQTIEIKRELVITAGDAGALILTVNGAEGRSLGKAAEVVTARINLTNFKDYLAR